MDGVRYLYFATYDPRNTWCKVWRDGSWWIPNMSFDDFLAVEKQMPDDVKYIGDADEVTRDFKNSGNPEFPFVSPTEEYGGQIFTLTDAAYKDCQRLWRLRAGLSPEPEPQEP